MDEFKKYLLVQKETLESDEPSEKVWSGIRSSLEAPAKSIPIQKWAIAASLILLVGLGILIFNRSYRTESHIVKSTHQEIIPPVREEKDSIIKKVETALATAENKQLNKQKNYPAASPITTIAKQRSRPSSASMSAIERSNKSKNKETDLSTNNEPSKPSAVSLRRQADLDMQAYVDNIVQRVQQQRIQEQMRNKEIRKSSILCIQAWIRGFLVRRRHKGISA